MACFLLVWIRPFSIPLWHMAGAWLANVLLQRVPSLIARGLGPPCLWDSLTCFSRPAGNVNSDSCAPGGQPAVVIFRGIRDLFQ